MAARQHHNDGRGTSGKGKKSRGSVKNAKRLDDFKGRQGKGNADWGGCDPANLLAVVVAITELGGAVTIGMSRDQGAHSLTLLLDDERQTLWFNGDAELDDELADVMGVLAAMS